MDPATVPHVHSEEAILEDRRARLAMDVVRAFEELATAKEACERVSAADFQAWLTVNAERVAADRRLTNLRAEYARLAPREP